MDATGDSGGEVLGFMPNLELQDFRGLVGESWRRSRDPGLKNDKGTSKEIV